MKISIIIPTLNEERIVGNLIEHLQSTCSEKNLEEIIIVDGGSGDNTIRVARSLGIKVLKSPRAGRACQMNHGWKNARGSILYFLHSDGLPPEGFDDKIISAVKEGYGAGCFRIKFRPNHPLLQAITWMVRFNVDWLRYGDQSLFVTKKIFSEINGFDEGLFIMEDAEIITRIKKKTPFLVLPDHVTTSSRKYQEFGYFRLQALYVILRVLMLFRLGNARIFSFYKKALH